MLNSTPRTWVTGELVTAAQLNTEIRDALTGIQSAWTAWTPTLTASVTNPVLGTGSAVTGRYQRIGKTIAAQGQITFGTSGYSVGSGSWFVSLPVAAAATEFDGNLWLFPGAGSWICGWFRYQTSTTASLWTPNTATTANLTQVTHAATPGGTAWGFPIKLRFQAVYEAA